MADKLDGGYSEDEIVHIKKSKLIIPMEESLKKPCVRYSLKWAIGISVPVFIINFMRSSSAKKSLTYANFSLTAIFLVTYLACRINLYNEQNKVRQLEPLLRSYAELYGTDKDKPQKLLDEDKDDKK